MKQSIWLVILTLVLGTVPAFCDNEHEPVGAPPESSVAPTARAATQATKAAWLTNLKEPQGLALDQNGNILVADYGAGQVLRYGRDGKLLGTLAEGLKSPAQIVVVGEKIYVSERKANRVIEISMDGKITQVGGEIVQPLGLTQDAQGHLITVAHTSSKVYRFDGQEWQMIYATYKDGGARRYGYRCLAFDGTILMSDEVGKEVLLLTTGGRIASWAKGISDPSGITIGPDGATYVCNEGDGGQLLKLSPDGEKTVVAEGLGRARGVLFLDADTALVSDRDGTVWKLEFPKE